jgi:hypothetical protein
MGFLNDARKRRFVRSRTVDPQQFEDVILELVSLGLLRTNGVTAEAVEAEGAPDIDIGFPNPTKGEVKHIRAGSSLSAVSSHLKKANRQVRNAGLEQAGVVFMHISRTGGRAQLDDRVPSDVRGYVNEVQRLLHRGQLRSLNVVVVSWVEYFVMANRLPRALFVPQRRTLIVNHPEPRTNLTVSVSDLTLDRALEQWVSYPPTGGPDLNSIRYGGIDIGGSFRAQNELRHGIRPEHVAEVVAEPDEQTTPREEGALVLLTRYVAAPPGHTLLFVGRLRYGRFPGPGWLRTSRQGT